MSTLEPSPLMALRTLTVQDVLWINLQVTRRVNHYSNPRLEEATYYQFGYGDSRDVESAAARLLSGFVRMKPFDAGNEPTALAATLSFLELNDKTLTIEDETLGELVRAGLQSPEAARSLIAEAIRDTGHADEAFHLGAGGAAGISDVRQTITRVIQRYPRSIAALETSVA